MHNQLALTEHVSLNFAPLILLDPVCMRRRSRCCRERARYRNFPPLTKQHPDPSTGLNESVIEFRATPMRVDENYSFYYVNLTRLIVTGIVPFGALAMLNFSIYR